MYVCMYVSMLAPDDQFYTVTGNISDFVITVLHAFRSTVKKLFKIIRKECRLNHKLTAAFDM